MAALLPEFVVNLETDMQEIMVDTTKDLTENMWWTELVKTRTSGALKDIFFWAVNTFRLRDEGQEGGNKHFEEFASKQTEITHRHAGGGIILKNDQLLDQDGRGLDQAAIWSRGAAEQMAYWPQEQTTDFLKLGHTSKYMAYDGVTYFANNHLVNPVKASTGTFANVFTGAASSTPSTDANDGIYPGACPIDASVTREVALANLIKVFAYIRSIKAPNGKQPRRRKVDKIFCGPSLYPYAAQLTNAKFIAQVASGNSASGDVEMLIKSLGYAQPVLCEELGDVDDGLSYFVSCKTLKSDPYGAIVYTEREPFSVNFYGMMTERELKQRNELEYHVDGRNSITGGHPDQLFKALRT